MAKQKTERPIDTLESTLEELELLCGDTRTDKPAEILERVTQLTQMVRCLARIVRLLGDDVRRTANETSCLANGMKPD